ncbi:MAG: tRNA (adenosine(37)-N6)-threonylcarbamoyltransferase complex dimerization subunit type 1 TsaB, partial [Candidatus Nanopelagicales bacterium]
MLILALDTATPAIGAAVLDTDTGQVRGRAGFVGPGAHGEQLAPVVAQALALAGITPRELDAVAVGRGPGPFTGLRVGLVHAAVMGWALGIGVHGVCTLDVLAAQARDAGVSGSFLVATDARRREVYWA